MTPDEQKKVDKLASAYAAYKTALASAPNGDAGKQFTLAKMYYFGRGTPQDLVQAYVWFYRSAWNKVPNPPNNPTNNVIKMASFKQLEKLEKTLTPDQLAQAKQILAK